MRRIVGEVELEPHWPCFLALTRCERVGRQAVARHELALPAFAGGEGSVRLGVLQLNRRLFGSEVGEVGGPVALLVLVLAGLGRAVAFEQDVVEPVVVEP